MKESLICNKSSFHSKYFFFKTFSVKGKNKAELEDIVSVPNTVCHQVRHATHPFLQQQKCELYFLHEANYTLEFF